MTLNFELIPDIDTYSKIPKGIEKWSSPSNIALIKYWGKLENQIPTNPSLSFTLDKSTSITFLEYCLKPNYFEELSLELFFEGKKNDKFKEKILVFFNRILKYAPYLKAYNYIIRTENTFPHSSGIASSASGMSAIALCLMSLEKRFNPLMTTEYFYQKASFLSRLGSGSASRSVYGGFAMWGYQEATKQGDNEFAIPYFGEVHPIFKDFKDTILLIEEEQKKVSSTMGHSLMNGHPFAISRFAQANHNLIKLQNTLAHGNLKEFGKIVENEALSLHAMMMTSMPSFILMHPRTLQVIHKLWDFRKRTRKHLYFTLDAGANVHLLYPSLEEKEIVHFINSELLKYCDGKLIFDRIGIGPKEMTTL